MRLELTRYTIRCSWVSRRDHTPGARYFSGSGFPIPANGSLTMASIRSNARSAVLRSVSTQWRRSSMNSGWKTVSRVRRAEDPEDLLSLNAEFPPEGFYGPRLPGAGDGPAQCPQ